MANMMPLNQPLMLPVDAHDGTAGEGAPVTVLGPVQDFVASSTEVKPKTDNGEHGASALRLKICTLMVKHTLMVLVKLC